MCPSAGAWGVKCLGRTSIYHTCATQYFLNNKLIDKYFSDGLSDQLKKSNLETGNFSINFYSANLRKVVRRDF